MINSILSILAILAIFIIPSPVVKLGTACVLCLCMDRVRFKLAAPAWFALAWLALATVGVYYADQPWLALWGFPSRHEGLLTCLGLFGVALALRGVGSTPIITAIVTWSGLVVAMTIVDPDSLLIPTPIAMGAVSACAFAYMLATMPLLCWVPAIPLVLADSRAGIVACVAVAVLVWRIKPVRVRMGREVRFAVASALILAAGMMLNPGLRAKIYATSVGFNGARTQWARTALVESTRLPLTGHGLDNTALLLRPATGPTEHKGAIPDRVHNVALDILIQTGWMGLALAGAALWGTVRAVLRERRACRGFDCPMELIDDTDDWQRYRTNLAGLATVTAWTVYGLLNPQGIPAHCMMLVALFQMKGKE